MRENDGNMLKNEIAALAARLDGKGRAALELGRRELLRIENAASEIRRLSALSACEGMARAEATARSVEACARGLAAEKWMSLPADRGVPRIIGIASLILAEGERGADIVTVRAALDEFDRTRGLTMAEFRSAPRAMRIAACRVWLSAAEGLIADGRDGQRAEKWAASGTGDIDVKSSAFMERALKITAETEKPELRARLSEALARADMNEDTVTSAFHKRNAMNAMRAENAAGVIAMLSKTDWQRVFESVSRTEACLREDPGGVYGAMTKSSREVVREEIAHLAERFKCGETAVAKMALKAAREYSADDERGSVCWWLYTDEGRSVMARRMGAKRRAGRMYIDPHGYVYMVLFAVLTAFFAVGAAVLCGSMWAMWLTLPIAWRIVSFCMGQFVTRAVRPRRALAMEYDRLPDDMRTLIVIPALIPSVERAGELVRQLEVLGCLEKDENIDLLLLGDFPDAPKRRMEGDAEIIKTVRRAIDEMNARAGRKKYHYLHREREFAKADGIFRGYARKRGALMALGRLISGTGGAEFAAEGRDADMLRGRFRYVVTLDADTKMLPGEAKKMVGVMSHPLNRYRRENGRVRGFSVMQPCVEIDPAGTKTAFGRLFGGQGGMSAYSVMVSELFWDIAGQGSYCGKGVIDMPAFTQALEGRLDDRRILSHDLIEGMLAGAGRINDVSVYDAFPETYGKYLARLTRWVRGDWQLLPELFRGDITPFDRFRLASNMINSLFEPALFTLFILSVWFMNRFGFSLAVIFALFEPIVSRIMGDKNALLRGCVELGALPAEAFARVAAIVKAIRRMITGKKLLEWVTFADEKGKNSMIKASCGAGAVLLLPGVFIGAWLLPSLALGALFAIAPGWLDELGRESIGEKSALSGGDRVMLTALGEDIWRFFAEYVNEQSNFLPPDNVQVDPPVGAAMRTSPTNIAMYMLSVVSARELGFIDGSEAEKRICDTMDTIDKMEKWNGHVLNWYDIRTLEPLRPRYVSSVDSGNLMAAFVLCAGAFEGEISERLRRAAVDMELECLYDSETELFHIGIDVERGTLSQARYDLLASESRILSYVSAMLGKTDIGNWRALGRPAADGAVLSWSGTMFEYLMPAIFMPSAPGTLLGESMRRVVGIQQDFGRSRGRPWGVSESGYHAFDMNMNYQYRAFGMRRLSMSGRVGQDVVAPYAACLALAVSPVSAVSNIKRMEQLGWRGRFGLYEAADYTHAQPDIVKSWMAHHQGMSLCAICNALKGDVLVDYFMASDQARALEMLLNEKPAPRIRLRRAEEVKNIRRAVEPPSEERVGRAGAKQTDTTVLGGAGATALITAGGSIAYSRGGVWACRFVGDLLRRRDGINTYVSAGGREMLVNSADSACVFGPGRAVFTTSADGVDIEMRACVSPENGALIRKIRFAGNSDVPVEVAVTDVFEVAMMDGGELRAHPAFFRLFCRADVLRRDGIVYTRARRAPGEEHMAMYHTACGAECEKETDWHVFSGRGFGGLRGDMFSGVGGAQTEPCSALRVKLTVEPGAVREIVFAIGLCGEDEVEAFADRCATEGFFERQQALSASHVRSVSEFAGLDAAKRMLCERAAAFIVDPRLSLKRGMGACKRPGGMPWDMPCVCLRLDGAEALEVFREITRMHRYLVGLGLKFHIALIDDCVGGYSRPVRDEAEAVIASCHLSNMRFVPGGVSVYDGETLSGAEREAITRSACLYFDGRAALWVQLRRALRTLQHTEREGYGDMPCEMSYPRGLWRFREDRLEFTVAPGHMPPAPWSNVIIADDLGMLITDRGGGFVWHGNSRLARVTGFDNDPSDEGWGIMIYVSDSSGFVRALPGKEPMGAYRVSHAPWETSFDITADDLDISTTIFADSESDSLQFLVRISNIGDRQRLIDVTAYVDWLMGADSSDCARMRCRGENGALFAEGAIPGTAYLAADGNAEAGPERGEFLGAGGIMRPDGLNFRTGGGGSALRRRVTIEPSESASVCFFMGVATDMQAARGAVLDRRDPEMLLDGARRRFEEFSDRFVLITEDETLDQLAGGFLLKQVLDGRIHARAGFYQAGGAFGFRDQLQDMLAILPHDPDMVRRHILFCAAHQFEDGDVMHWWHEGPVGVRTRISDDMLFLPFVTAAYVRYTGDIGILNENAGYLENMEIPEGKDDIYGEGRPSGLVESLRGHCMRAFERAWRRGEHSLLLMGGGDWNDGMNRVGINGRGESVWLSMFYARCADDFAAVTDVREDAMLLMGRADELRAAVEQHGWDGEWYLRAYDDNGKALGTASSEECRIDLISQAWSVLAGMDAERARIAMDSAGRLLFDRDAQIIRLLTPPFTGKGTDAGYISAYPMGIRENGGQYTHAACWYLLALSEMGDARGAREALEALLPVNHALTAEDIERYRVEPYVLAGDVYGEEPFTGRGGWTWYTGAAGWFINALMSLAGFERRGDRVRLNALRGVWDRPQVVIRYGGSVYRLISDADAVGISVDGVSAEGDYAQMTDDGQEHVCVFPQRGNSLPN